MTIIPSPRSNPPAIATVLPVPSLKGVLKVPAETIVGVATTCGEFAMATGEDFSSSAVCDGSGVVVGDIVVVARGVSVGVGLGAMISS